MSKINECIEPAGLVGLDKLYSHMIKSDLQTLINLFQNTISNDSVLTEITVAITNQASSLSPSLSQPTKLYSNYVSKLTKIAPKMLDLVLAIGQKQIIRKYIAFELNTSCKFNSKNLESTLRTMNKYDLKLKSVFFSLGIKCIYININFFSVISSVLFFKCSSG